MKQKRDLKCFGSLPENRRIFLIVSLIFFFLLPCKLVFSSSEYLPDRLHSSSPVDNTVAVGFIIYEGPGVSGEQVLQRRISGTVTDVDGQALVGVTVAVKGTTTGVFTGNDGSFSMITSESSPTLVFSFVGMKTQEIEVPPDVSVLNVVMEDATFGMGEIVVTALGIEKESRALAYNVQKIDADEAITLNDGNLINGLAGKVAGVTINSSSSGIGGSSRVVMRGTKSIAGNNNTLYVIDGIPMLSLQTGQPADIFSGAGQTGDGIANFNSADIESISILSGPAAAALYGSEAANGVVMITTKKGSEDGLSFGFSNNTTFHSPFVMPKFQNTYGVSDIGSYYSWGEKLETPSSYDPKEFFQTGYNLYNSIDISTGNENNKTYFSAGSMNAEGIIYNNNYDRYNFSLRNTSSLLNDRLNLDLSAMYMSTQENNMLAQGQYFNPLIPVYLFPAGDEIVKYRLFERYDVTRNFKTQYWPFGDLGFQMQNPYWIIQRNLFINNKNRYLLGAALKYNILDWINVTGRVNMDRNHSANRREYFASTSGLFAGDAGAYHRYDIVNRQVYADVLVNIDKYIGDFWIAANVGASLRDVIYSSSNLSGNLQSVPNLFTYENLNKSTLKMMEEGFHDQTQAIFATAQLGYKRMVYLDMTARNDWVSALANTNTRSIFYPSVGLSGIITDLFKIESDILSYAKARVSYSEVGNAPQRFISIPSYPVVEGYPQLTSYLPAKDLEPERTKSYEAGLNLILWNNKVNLDIALYKSETYNQLFNPSLSPSSGYSSFFVNAGRIDNKGIESSLRFNQDFGILKWTSNVVFSLNRNKIVELLHAYTNEETGETVSMTRLDMGGTASAKMILEEGGSMGDIYVNTLHVDEHGYIYVNPASFTVSANQNEFVKAGNTNPKYLLGFRNSLSYRGFDLTCLVNARVGGVGVSVTQAIMDAFGVSEATANARDAGGAEVNGFLIPAQPYYQTIGGGTSGIGSMYVYSATNVRLAELSFGYEIPVNKITNRIESVHLSLVGRNLFMFYNTAPYDPENTANTGTYFQGIDYFMQPSYRSIGFGIDCRF
jgi:TonB-linked SusC/RagA family outer membrane protein